MALQFGSGSGRLCLSLNAFYDRANENVPPMSSLCSLLTEVSLKY